MLPSQSERERGRRPCTLFFFCFGSPPFYGRIFLGAFWWFAVVFVELPGSATVQFKALFLGVLFGVFSCAVLSAMVGFWVGALEGS